MSNLPQQQTYNQYPIMGAPQSIFTYNFLVLQSADMNVYLTPAGQPPSVTDLLDPSLYTVNNVGNENGGTVTLNSAAQIGDIVLLILNMQISINTNFLNAQTFNGANLDLAFERITLFSNQINTIQQQRCLQYPINDYFPNTAPVPNIIPPFTQENQIWQYVNGQIAAVVLEENPDVSTLRAQLAINAGAENAGALLVGYYNSITTTPSNLNDFLQDLQNSVTATKGAALLGYNGTISPATTIKAALENLQTQITNLTTTVDGLVAVGDIIYSGIEKNSATYLFCNGAAISRTTYATLFAAIGIAFGAGDGTTTFNVPNLIHKFPYGSSVGDQGEMGGAATVSLTKENLAPHTHTFSGFDETPPLTLSSSNNQLKGATLTTSNGSEDGLASTPFSILPPYQGLLPYIRYA